MSRSRWLIAVLGMSGVLIILGVLSQCRVSRSGNIARVTISPTHSTVIRENTVEMVNVTQTPSMISAELSPTVPTVTTSTIFVATPTQLPALQTGIPMLPAGGPGAAANLQSEATCNPDDAVKGTARLSWTPSVDRGTEQRVALTTYVRGMETGAFVVTEPLSPDEQGYIWERTSPRITHYWWVLTLHAEGWVPSEVASFEGAICVSDFAQSPAPQ